MVVLGMQGQTSLLFFIDFINLECSKLQVISINIGLVQQQPMEATWSYSNGREKTDVNGTLGLVLRLPIRVTWKYFSGQERTTVLGMKVFKKTFKTVFEYFLISVHSVSKTLKKSFNFQFLFFSFFFFRNVLKSC